MQVRLLERFRETQTLEFFDSCDGRSEGEQEGLLNALFVAGRRIKTGNPLIALGYCPLFDHLWYFEYKWMR